jgi:glycosyltransferase involved in cell wall biosynthesis
MNKPMRILFISRATLYIVKGGDTIQILKTAEELSKLNVLVDIKLCNDNAIDYSIYDLIHFFNIIRPADIIIHIKKSKKPFVVSTIYVDYSDYETYSAKTNWKRKILNLFGSNTREYLKALARWIFNREKINSVEYFWWGHRKSVVFVLSNASLLLPNSESEYQRLFKNYGISKEYIVVNNAADVHTFNCTPETIANKNKNLVLCVARIEGRKNQYNLIKALNNSAFNLFIIGNPAPNHIHYYNECRSIAASNIQFINEISQSELIDYYRNAKVHVLPSWFETTGLSSLEALYCGCNIVVSEYGDTHEYFDKTKALYCDPQSIESIRVAITRASQMEGDLELINEIMLKYNWEKTALSTVRAYNRILHK